MNHGGHGVFRSRKRAGGKLLGGFRWAFGVTGSQASRMTLPFSALPSLHAPSALPTIATSPIAAKPRLLSTNQEPRNLPPAATAGALSVFPKCLLPPCAQLYAIVHALCS